jgi:hypothetical protein
MKAGNYEPTPVGIMNCLADAVLRIAGMPMSDDEKQAAAENLINIAASGLSIEDLQQIAGDGLRECERRLKVESSEVGQ